MFALVDCNNFYASCERAFNPQLRNKPVVVLSNNDGCAIARSQEAKALGIKMGQPIFKCWDLVKQHDVKVYSSNFVLYGDMSQRVMKILSEFSLNMEVYSIDEAFLSLDGFEHYGLQSYGSKIRDAVKQRIGLPVSVGIAKTKTLAKVANHIAKKDPERHNVFCLLDDNQIELYLKRLPVEKVWGVGRRRSRWLKHQGIETAYQLKAMPDAWLKQHLTITGLRTAQELRGISCIPLESMSAAKKAIATTRSFGYEVTNINELKEAICAYTAKTAEKVRKQNSVAGYLQIFIESNPFKPEHYYENSIGTHLSPPTAYTPRLTTLATSLLEKIYKSGYAYKRAGVILLHLTRQADSQNYLFDESYIGSKSQRLMDAIDKVNLSVNDGKLLFASEGLGKPWYMRQAHKSRRFTTRWGELLEVVV